MAPETLFIIACILQAGDIYTTLRAIKLGAVESNPVVLKFMRGFGIKEGLLLVKIATLIPLWVFRDLEQPARDREAAGHDCCRSSEAAARASGMLCGLKVLDSVN